MARVMERSACLLLLLFLVVAVVEAGPHKAKKVKCQDKRYPTCYHKDLYCPNTCLRTCAVDCATCQPFCPTTPPPPPPPSHTPVHKQKKVKCDDKKFPTCYHKDLYCPVSCPRTCVVDCAKCQPVCSVTPSPPLPSPPTPSSPPPPTPSPSPSTPTTTPSSPPSPSPKTAKCRLRNYPQCYGMEHTCPVNCPNNCEVDCDTCKPVCDCIKAGGVCEDPRFVGADGITFYFHGQKDKDFCLVSDSNIHINAHFIGRRNENMKRDFTWVQSLGILFDNHKLYIGAKKTATWDDAIDRLALVFDDEPIFLPDGEGTKWQPIEAPDTSITRTGHTNTVEIEVRGNFKIKATVVPITEKDSKIHSYGITQDDCFAHLDLSFKFYGLSGHVNGVLGQTYASNYVSRVKMGVVMPVLGGEEKFSSSTLFTADCAVARFTGELAGPENFEYAKLDCASGMDGRGVVCKR
ncbi:hypothetical protein SLEP1_g7428 [Rubroshorea leprosula]|uniref:Root cap n=1 Tax=Rubroshorea leprosula TaxID=152421 RepID=A0AAV5I850_9ROSI|nr:hypothetical protein SLEP1_g7428 [Rubroshorea leprosula]